MGSQQRFDRSAQPRVAGARLLQISRPLLGVAPGQRLVEDFFFVHDSPWTPISAKPKSPSILRGSHSFPGQNPPHLPALEGAFPPVVTFLPLPLSLRLPSRTPRT